MLIQNVPTKLSMSRSQLREQICQTSKSDRQEWQSPVVLNGTNISLKGTNISFLKFICGTLNRGVANSVWNHVIQISSIQMYFQDIYSNLWKVKLFSGNIHCKKSWRSSSTPASGDAGPKHTGIEKSFRHTYRKFYYKYRTILTDFYKCRTSSIELDYLKSNITQART